MPYHTTTTAASLSPGVAKQLVGPNNNRNELTIQVTGTGSATIGFGSAPTAAGLGLTLAGASAAGGQGGSRVWALPAHNPHFDKYYERKDTGDAVPSQSIWAISTAGTTIVVIEQLP